MGKNQLAYITVPDKDTAIALARGIVDAQLAAGANLAGPVRSFYHWNGEVRDAEEWQIFAQTANSQALTEWVRKRHPHLVPCIIFMPIESGFGPFLDWISEHSKSDTRGNVTGSSGFTA